MDGFKIFIIIIKKKTTETNLRFIFYFYIWWIRLSDYGQISIRLFIIKHRTTYFICVYDKYTKFNIISKLFSSVFRLMEEEKNEIETWPTI